MRRLIVILLMLVALLPRQSITAQPPDSDAPYIYYYSARLNAFVIERADGSDSRIFGDVALHPSTNSVFGTGWSPSGKWFAFITKQRQPFGFYETLQTILLDVNGEAHELPELPGEIDSIRWGQSEDILLIVMLEPAEGTPAEIKHFYLYEVESQTIVAELITLPHLDVPFASFYWQEGEWIAAGYKDAVNLEHVYKVVDLVTGTESVTNFPQSNFSARVSGIRDNGWIIENRDGDYFAFNLFSEQEFDMSVDKVYFSYHSHDGKYAIIVEDRDQTSHWIVDFDLQTVTKLPDTGQLALFPRWSPNMRFLVLQDREHLLYLYEFETTELTPLGLKADTRYREEGWYYDQHNRLVVFNSLDINSRSGELYIFDGVEQQLSLDIPLSQNTTPTFSIDDKYVGIVDEGVIIKDISNTGRYKFQPHSGSYLSSLGGEVRWHELSNWFFGFEEAFLAGGAQGLRWVTIGNADKKCHRDLTYCAVVTATCIGWLPDNVDINTLPAGQKTSVTALPAPKITIPIGSWWYVPVWSEDGQYILADEMIFNATTGEIVDNTDNIAFTESQQFIYDEKNPRGDYFVDSVDTIEGPDEYWLFDDKSKEQLFQLPLFMRSVDVSSDGQYLVTTSVSVDYTYLWDIESQEIIVTLPYSPYATFSPDGTKLATGVSWEVWIWAVEDLVAE